VVVIGEALVDIVIRPDGTKVATPGASPMKVAVTLARLGVPAHLASSLGDDEYGELVRTQPARSGASLCLAPAP
jgi:fructokinase